jgi:hypothetical protein
MVSLVRFSRAAQPCGQVGAQDGKTFKQKIIKMKLSHFQFDLPKELLVNPSEHRER